MMRCYSRLAVAFLCASGLLEAHLIGLPVAHAARSAGNLRAVRTYSSDFIKTLQQELKRAGYDPGDADGKMGPATRRALRRFQEDRGLPPTGDLDIPTLTKLLEQGQPQ
jgi:hypothetical protein